MKRDAVVMEGRALLWIPDPSEALLESRLEPAWLPVFYNPVMEFNRDFSVAALQAYVDLYAPHRPVTVVEPLTATGVRSVRYALEVEGVGRVVAGDIDENAVKYARRNVLLNEVGRIVTVVRADASALLYRLAREEPEPVLVVDLDPFGSPAPYLDAALTAVGHRGLLAATATDLAVLEGSKPKAARRKYWAALERAPHAKEVAVRALLGFIARVAASHDKAIRPLAAYWSDHYVRVYALIERGARRADRVLEECVSMATWCRDLGHTLFVQCPVPSRAVPLGPLWSCEIGDASFLERVKDVALKRHQVLRTSRRVVKLATILAGEAPLSRKRFYYELWALASATKANVPPKKGFADILSSAGWTVSETHFSTTGIRSDAPLLEVTTLLQSFRRGAP